MNIFNTFYGQNERTHTITFLFLSCNKFLNIILTHTGMNGYMLKHPFFYSHVIISLKCPIQLFVRRLYHRYTYIYQRPNPQTKKVYPNVKSHLEMNTISIYNKYIGFYSVYCYHYIFLCIYTEAL